MKSNPISLTAGKNYYLEIRHIETTGADHLTVGFELDPDGSVAANHP